METAPPSLLAFLREPDAEYMGFHVRQKRKAKISNTTAHLWMCVRAPRVTGIQVEELRNRFGYSADQIADLLGLPESAISTLLASSDPLPREICERIWAVQHTLQFVPKNKRKVGRRPGPTADTERRILLAADCAVRGLSKYKMASFLYPGNIRAYGNIRAFFHSHKQRIEAETKRLSAVPLRTMRTPMNKSERTRGSGE